MAILIHGNHIEEDTAVVRGGWCHVLFNANFHTLNTHLKDDGSDEGVNGWSEGERRALEIPQHDATLREDGEQV